MLKTFPSMSKNERNSFFPQKLLMLKMSQRRRKMEIWQSCRKEMRKPKHSCSMSENVKKNLLTKNKHYISWCSKAHVECPLFIFAEIFVEVRPRQPSSKTQTDGGKNPILTEKPLFFKTLHCTRRLHFWQIRLTMSVKKLKFLNIKTVYL